MDSISQAALGAVIGETVLGPKIGNRALLWGAVAGTIPDLDVLFYPLMDEIARLGWHRGISHSLLLNCALAPALGWVFFRLNGRRGSVKEWSVLALACLLTAVLLDCFTVYGTQVFQPFSDYQIGFNTISIVDPLYTAPLLLSIAAALFLRRLPAARRAVILSGLTLSTLYMGLSIVIKNHVNSIVRDSLAEKSVLHARVMTTPTLFNTVLWRATAEVPGGFYVGYYSLFDTRPAIDFRFIDKNDHLLKDIRDSRAVAQLQWFSNGWYTVEELADGSLAFSDLRFGEIYTDSDRQGQYVFTWKLVTDQSGTVMTQVDPAIDDAGKAMQFLWQRIRGH